jgi:predicted SAM-dependent methyltransferase
VYATEDMKQLDYQDQTFDVIVCSHVLEHMKDDILMMKELYRVMKDTGWGIFQVPIALSLKRTYEDPYIITPEERNRAYGQEDHVRIYARKDYVGRLKSAGFTFKPIHVSEICKTNIWKYGFSQTDVLYIVTKEKDQNISFLKRLYHKIFGK